MLQNLGALCLCYKICRCFVGVYVTKFVSMLIAAGSIIRRKLH